MTITPRWFQRESIDQGIFEFFVTSTGNPIIVVPTGGGKSIIIALASMEIIKNWPNQRILICTHVKELVEQNFEKVKLVWPESSAGVYSASVGRRDTQESIIVGGLQSIYKKAHVLGRFDLIFIDECHLLSEDSEGMYQKLIKQLMKFNPKLKIIGLSATPFRMKSGHLVGEDSIFTDVSYEIDIKTLIDEGFLCPPIPKRMKTDYEMDKIKNHGKEYSLADMQRKMDKEELTISAVNEIVEWGQDRRSWLVFCSGVDHAYHVRDEIRSRGYTCETITGKTKKSERARIIAEFKNGNIKAITNADVLTTGFDAPGTDLLAIMRGTKSPGLWVQIVGRGMRVSPETGKENCLVLDFGKNSEYHGPIDQIILAQQKKKKRKKGEAPMKACPGCNTYVLSMLRFCPSCGHEFEINETPSFLGTADDKELLSFNEKENIQELLVNRLFFKKHTTAKGASLAVSYYRGVSEVAREYVFLEYSGIPRLNAVNWWRLWVDQNPPKTVDDALAALGTMIDLSSPVKVTVDKSGKYPKVIGYDLTEAA